VSTVELAPDRLPLLGNAKSHSTNSMLCELVALSSPAANATKMCEFSTTDKKIQKRMADRQEATVTLESGRRSSFACECAPENVIYVIYSDAGYALKDNMNNLQ